MHLYEIEKKVDLLGYVGESHNLIKRKGGEYYFVEPCPACGHKDHFVIFPKTNSFSSYSKCIRGGGVYNYLVQVEGLSKQAAIKKLLKLANEEYKGDVDIEPLENVVPKQKTDFTKFIERGFENSFKAYASEIRDFFVARGVTINEIMEHKLFVYKDRDGMRAVFPIWKSGKVISYTARALENQEPRYKNSPGEKLPYEFFGINELEKESDKPIIIVEGQIDKLNLEFMGFRAISLNGISNFPRFMEYIKMTGIIEREKFLTAFDNDKAGQDAAKGSVFKNIIIPNQWKDINEWYFDSLKSLSKNVIEEDILNLEIYKSLTLQLENPTKKDSVIDYLITGYAEDSEKLEKWKNISTGFKNIDRHIKNVTPALYIIGGVPSIGKTTFLQQLSTGIINNPGCEVIMFSYEQTKLELVNKDLNRISAQKNIKQLQEVMMQYAPIAGRLSIVEADFTTTVEDVRSYVENYKRFNKTKLVLLIDYLQIIAPPRGNENLSDKAKVDRNLAEIKTLSKELHIPVFLVSSLNRTNYTEPIDYESFKESGSIEYFADHLWGLQLSMVNDVDSKKSTQQKKEILNAEKKKKIREVEIVSIKGRNIEAGFAAKFNYYTDKDMYVER